MEEYSVSLTLEEYEEFVKELKIYMIREGLNRKDLANKLGYSLRTVSDALSSYERCSKFFIAAAQELMGRDK